jgi:hypothetical protein
MFIRLKDIHTNDVNININHIIGFQPSDSGGSTLSFSNGTSGEVLDSPRSIRGYVKKALFAMHTGGAGPEEAVSEG